MSTGKFSTVFIGTPEFAIPSLKALLNHSSITVKAVLTQPDKPAGRGQLLTPPPVKQFAIENGIQVFQLNSLKGLELKNGLIYGTDAQSPFVEFLNNNKDLDAFVTVAYGKIIPQALLEFSRCGVINVHPSLLPRWRGAAPIQHTIFSGDTNSGVCLMKADEGLDTGPVFCKTELDVPVNWTFGAAHDELSVIGASLLAANLLSILENSLSPIPQRSVGATYAEKWEREDLIIRWSEPAAVSTRRVQASCPIPGARTWVNGELLKILAATAAPLPKSTNAIPGTIIESTGATLIVACGENSALSLKQLQLPGKKSLPIAEFQRGNKIPTGTQFKDTNE